MTLYKSKPSLPEIDLPEAKNYVRDVFRKAGNFAKKHGKGMYEAAKDCGRIPEILLREKIGIPEEMSVKDGLKTSIKNIYSNLTDKDWYKRNWKPVVYYGGLIGGSIALSIAYHNFISEPTMRETIVEQNLIPKGSFLFPVPYRGPNQSNPRGMLLYRALHPLEKIARDFAYEKPVVQGILATTPPAGAVGGRIKRALKKRK